MTNKFSGFSSFLMLIGRICFGLIFIIAGYQKLVMFSSISAQLASKGMPYADMILVISTILELGGGLLILLGWYARFGAFLLFLFVIPVTYVFHSFWGLADPDMTNQMWHFLKNISIIGGALYIMAVGAGRYSIDGWVRKV